MVAVIATETFAADVVRVLMTLFLLLLLSYIAGWQTGGWWKGRQPVKLTDDEKKDWRELKQRIDFRMTTDVDLVHLHMDGEVDIDDLFLLVNVLEASEADGTLLEA